MNNPRKTQTYYDLESLLKDCVGTKEEQDNNPKWVRFWTIRWKKGRYSRDNPYVLRSVVSLEQDRKEDIKRGKFKVSTRNEQKELREVLETDPLDD